jgi:hypothetical protein
MSRIDPVIEKDRVAVALSSGTALPFLDDERITRRES